jgi:hypothetical protein
MEEFIWSPDKYTSNLNQYQTLIFNKILYGKELQDIHNPIYNEEDNVFLNYYIKIFDKIGSKVLSDYNKKIVKTLIVSAIRRGKENNIRELNKQIQQFLQKNKNQVFPKLQQTKQQKQQEEQRIDFLKRIFLVSLFNDEETFEEDSVLFNHYKTIFENNKSIFVENTDVEKFLSSIIRKVENKKEEMEKSTKKVYNIDTKPGANHVKQSGAEPKIQRIKKYGAIRLPVIHQD